jgi:SAM-dependent methyltransferase
VANDARFRALVQAAAQRYRPAGRGAYHFAQGKLAGDPVFAAILQQGLIRDGARLTDLGCGQAVLLALLASAESASTERTWPRGWPPPPRNIKACGVDLRAAAIATARVALNGYAELAAADVRDFIVPASDVVTVFDVLHYIDFDAQRRLLEGIHAALAPGGRLLLRAGDASQGWRFRLTLAGDWLITLLRGHWQRRFFCRTGAQWQELLGEIGFTVELQPMHAGTPFANVLLVAEKRAVL